MDYPDFKSKLWQALLLLLQFLPEIQRGGMHLQKLLRSWAGWGEAIGSHRVQDPLAVGTPGEHWGTLDHQNYVC